MKQIHWSIFTSSSQGWHKGTNNHSHFKQIKLKKSVVRSHSMKQVPFYFKRLEELVISVPIKWMTMMKWLTVHLFPQWSGLKIPKSPTACVFGCAPASRLILSFTSFLSSPFFMCNILHGLCPSVPQQGHQIEGIEQRFCTTINEIQKDETVWWCLSLCLITVHNYY